MSNRTPPRYVPTLTEVVKPTTGSESSTPDDLSQEQLIARVMQRVDLNLERRLREAIASTILEQTRSIAPLLRDQIESAVRQTVSQAVADELAGQRTQK
jgi:biotin-(acetyl-CoA carboxylase) ligase